MPTIKNYQEDPYKNYLAKTKSAESGGDTNEKAKTSSALGQFQFLEGTWKAVVDKYNLGYSLEDRRDPKKSEEVMRLSTKDNEQQLRPILGRDLTDSERYLGHFLGVGGASNIFKASKKDPNMPVNYYLPPKTIEANRSVFYNKDGSIKTTKQIYDWADKKMSIKPTFSKDVAPYMSMNQPTTNDVTDFGISIDSSKFASVPNIYKEEETKSSEALNILKEKEAEKNFMEDFQNLFPKVEYTQQQQEAIQPSTPTDVMGIYNQVSEFVDQPAAQQGGEVDLYGNPIMSSKKINPNINRSYYDPRTNSMNIGTDYDTWVKEQGLQEDLIAHENYHAKQFKEGRGNFDIAHNTDNKVWTEMQKRPQLPTTDEVYYTFHNRKGIENFIGTEELKKQIPENIFLPNTFYDLALNKKVDSDLYNNPYTMEGETMYYTQTGEDFYKQMGGKIIKDNYGYWNPNNWGKKVQIEGGEQKYTENELAFLSEIAIKDNNGQWANPGKITEISSNQITMKGVEKNLLGISKETGEKKVMKPNKNYFFKNTKNVIEIPLR